MKAPEVPAELTVTNLETPPAQPSKDLTLTEVYVKVATAAASLIGDYSTLQRHTGSYLKGVHTYAYTKGVNDALKLILKEIQNGKK